MAKLLRNGFNHRCHLIRLCHIDRCAYRANIVSFDCCYGLLHILLD